MSSTREVAEQSALLNTLSIKEAMMDTFTDQHLTRWLEATVLTDERETVEQRMRGFVADYPDVLERMSWPEIRHLAEREL